MGNKINTLLIYSNGYGKKSVLFNTLVRGILKIKYDFKVPSIFKNSKLFYIGLNYLLNQYEFLSYVNDWREAFIENKKFNITALNIYNYFEKREIIKKISKTELIIILHSAFGDDLSQIETIVENIAQRKNSVVVSFIGNEYDLMEQKINLLKQIKCDYICSQLPVDSARFIYKSCSSAQILAMPHALNPKIFFNKGLKREFDIGFIGAKYPLFIGDSERNDFIEKIQKHKKALGINTKIQIGKRKNMPRKDWAEFLNKCRATIGAEAGTYYFDRNGELLTQAKEYIKNNPNSQLKEIYNKFFNPPNLQVVSGKTLSSRHFEPIGTHTCQILLRGNYNEILIPDMHYIPVSKDLSDIEEAFRKFHDKEYRNKIIENAYNLVINEHTYFHRINYLLSKI